MMRAKKRASVCQWLSVAASLSSAFVDAAPKRRSYDRNPLNIYSNSPTYDGESSPIYSEPGPVYPEAGEASELTSYITEYATDYLTLYPSTLPEAGTAYSSYYSYGSYPSSVIQYSSTYYYPNIYSTYSSYYYPPPASTDLAASYQYYSSDLSSEISSTEVCATPAPTDYNKEPPAYSYREPSNSATPETQYIQPTLLPATISSPEPAAIPSSPGPVPISAVLPVPSAPPAPPSLTTSALPVTPLLETALLPELTSYPLAQTSTAVSSTTPTASLDKFGLLLTLRELPSENDRINLLDQIGGDGAFKFDFNNPPPTAEVVGPGGRAVAASGKDFPAALGSGVSLAVVTLGACGLVVPHIHARATENMIVQKGVVQTEFMADNGTPLISNTLTELQSTVFPQGSLHYEFNPTCDPTTLISAFSSDDPGVLVVAPTLLSMDNKVISNSLGSQSTVYLKSTVPQSILQTVAQCQINFGVNSRNPTFYKRESVNTQHIEVSNPNPTSLSSIEESFSIQSAEEANDKSKRDLYDDIMSRFSDDDENEEMKNRRRQRNRQNRQNRQAGRRPPRRQVRVNRGDGYGYDYDAVDGYDNNRRNSQRRKSQNRRNSNRKVNNNGRRRGGRDRPYPQDDFGSEGGYYEYDEIGVGRRRKYDENGQPRRNNREEYNFDEEYQPVNPVVNHDRGHQSHRKAREDYPEERYDRRNREERYDHSGRVHRESPKEKSRSEKEEAHFPERGHRPKTKPDSDDSDESESFERIDKSESSDHSDGEDYYDSESRHVDNSDRDDDYYDMKRVNLIAEPEKNDEESDSSGFSSNTRPDLQINVPVKEKDLPIPANEEFSGDGTIYVPFQKSNTLVESSFIGPSIPANAQLSSTTLQADTPALPSLGATVTSTPTYPTGLSETSKEELEVDERGDDSTHSLEEIYEQIGSGDADGGGYQQTDDLLGPTEQLQEDISYDNGLNYYDNDAEEEYLEKRGIPRNGNYAEEKRSQPDRPVGPGPSTSSSPSPSQSWWESLLDQNDRPSDKPPPSQEEVSWWAYLENPEKLREVLRWDDRESNDGNSRNDENQRDENRDGKAKEKETNRYDDRRNDNSQKSDGRTDNRYGNNIYGDDRNMRVSKALSSSLTSSSSNTPTNRLPISFQPRSSSTFKGGYPSSAVTTAITSPAPTGLLSLTNPRPTDLFSFPFDKSFTDSFEDSLEDFPF